MSDTSDVFKTSELQALLDRESVRNCIIQLARGEDRRSADIISASFWPDANTNFGIFQGSFPQYLDWVVPGSPAVPVTQHILGQILVELRGDTALAETHVNSYHRIDMGEENRDVVIGGRYLDKLEKRDGEWRIAERTMLYDWVQDYGLSADWSQGVMGQPFSAEHFSGRSNGDYSQTFFSK